MNNIAWLEKKNKAKKKKKGGEGGGGGGWEKTLLQVFTWIETFFYSHLREYDYSSSRTDTAVFF